MNRYLTTSILAAAMVAAAAPEAFAQGGGIGGQLPQPENPPTRQGTRGANFLEIGIGARGNAMAGAVASFIDGGTALYWNPAGIAGEESFTLAATRQNLYQGLDITQNYAAAAIPFFGGVAGASFNSLNSGDIPRTEEDNPFGDPVTGQTFEWTSMAVSLAYARRLTDRLDVGAQGRYISEGISDARLSWVGLDFGTQFRTGIYGLIVGASIQNVGGSSRATGQAIEDAVDTDDFLNRTQRVSLYTRDTDLPTMYRFSVGADILGRVGSIMGQRAGGHSLVAEVAVADAIDTDVQLALGAEYGFRNIAFVRGGKRFYNDDRATEDPGLYGLSGGLGVRLPIGGGRAVRFDYAYTAMGELDNMQVFSFEFTR